MSNNLNKFTEIIPIFKSGLKEIEKKNPNLTKGLDYTPSYIINNFEDLFQDKQKLRLKGLGKSLKSLQQYNNIITKFFKKSNSLHSLIELNKLSSEGRSLTRYNFKKELKINNQKIKFSKENNDLSNNISLDNTLIDQINFPLNLFIQKNSNYNFRLRNFIKLITKYYPNLTQQNNVIFKFYNNNKLIRNLYTLLESAFTSMHCLISKPKIYYINDKIFIKLFFFPDLKLNRIINKILASFYKKIRIIKFKNKYRRKSTILKLRKIKFHNNKTNKFFDVSNYKSPFLKKYKFRLKILCRLLSKIFNKPVQLELIKLHYPFYDPNILANLLSYFVDYVKIRYLFKYIFSNIFIKRPKHIISRKRFSLLPGYLTGISVKFAGKFPTQRIVPKKTVKIKDLGNLARKKTMLVENARFSNKNKRGSFSISVSTGLILGNFFK